MAAGGERTHNVVIGPGDDAWIWWENVKTANPSSRAIRKEIEEFERMRNARWYGWSEAANANVWRASPNCPYYQKLYNEELDKYLASAGLSW